VFGYYVATLGLFEHPPPLRWKPGRRANTLLLHQKGAKKLGSDETQIPFESNTARQLIE
jgi:hypothetical protein